MNIPTSSQETYLQEKTVTVSYTRNDWNNYAQLAVAGAKFTPGSASYDSFDIRDNKFVTNFRSGVVHFVYSTLQNMMM